MCSIHASQAPCSAAVAPVKRSEIWADAGTCYQRRRPGSGSRFCRKRVSHCVRSWLSSLAYASSFMRVCVYLTVASSQYAVALSRPHTFPYPGQGNASQVMAPGPLDRQGLGLRGMNLCQSNLCEILKFTRATGVGEWNVLVGMWELILLGFAWLCGEPKADCCY